MRIIVWRRSGMTYNFCRLLKFVPFIALLALLVVPIRNFLFYFAIPGLWAEHSSLVLLKVILASQYFPIEESYQEPSPVKLNIDYKAIQNKINTEKQIFSAFDRQISLLQKRSLTDRKANIELEELLQFKPQMSEYERSVALFTLEVFVTACEAANLTYFLISGSSLGAVRHHGIIPWDDDIDLMMNASQWRRIHSVLSNVPGFELFAPKNVQWKFFLKSLPQGNRAFKWPNVDIFFFGEDETHIWAQTWGAKGSLCSKKLDVFPLTRRKFEKWNLPVPRHVDYLVSAEFGDFNSICKTATYIHKTNVALSQYSVISIDCKKLHNVFPFVFRNTSKSGAIIEVCKVAGQNVGNITMRIDY